VKLIAAAVRVSFDEDLDHYRVISNHLLENPGDPVRVRMGVPVSWNQPGQPIPAGALDEAMAGIEIWVNGRRHGCTFERQEPVAEIDDPAAAGGARVREAIAIRGWCVAEVEIPAGPGTELLLSYRGELFFTDTQAPGSPWPVFKPRDLAMPVFPPASWGADPVRVDVSVDMGPYTDLAQLLEPTGAWQGDGMVRMHFDNAAPASLPWVVVRAEAERPKQSQLISTWNRQEDRVAFKARANSSAKQGNEGSFVVDGKPGTAWCEGVSGLGEQSWVELTAPVNPRTATWCNLAGIGIVPGDARSQEAWTGRGRVSKVRISPCGSEDGPVADLSSLSSAHRPGAAYIKLQEGPGLGTLVKDVAGAQAIQDLWKRSTGNICLRVTVVGAEPGRSSDDTCISEIMAALQCSN
jgi:hypothetical protein